MLSTTGATRAMEAWQPTVDHLNATATEAGMAVRFTLRPQTTGSLQQAGANGELDLVLSDPAQFVAAEVEWQARAILG
ncbi:MAG: phosphate/phosphite/phosphonate ABC transporter substrate-binding protein, partial [Shimia sp.]|nr:phosphate/phosphite/phosphonate ABC transporter substrate-binding protein [Shimia sp.]